MLEGVFLSEITWFIIPCRHDVRDRGGHYSSGDIVRVVMVMVMGRRVVRCCGVEQRWVGIVGG